MIVAADRFILALIGLTLASCARGPQGSLRTTSMKIGSQTFALEVADTEATQRVGLMKRDSMPSDHGMIFVFDREEERQFWMKDTRIALDILYLDARGKVISIKQMKPYDKTAVASDGPAKYAIELNLGEAARCGVKVGDILTLPDLSH